MSSGLVHEIDAKVTARGRQIRVTFPHKLLMDYLAAWYLCKQNIQEIMEQELPTWRAIKKYEEVVKACCGLMKGREEVMSHIIKAYKEEIKEGKWLHSMWKVADIDDEHMESFQNESGAQIQHFVVYPKCGRPLSEVLNTAKLVVIYYLADSVGEYDPTLPCNADIVIIQHYMTLLHMNEDMRTLQRYRDHIIAIHLEGWPDDQMEHVSSLMLSSSLAYLSISNEYEHSTMDIDQLKIIISSLAQMPQLMYLYLDANTYLSVSGSSDKVNLVGDLLLAAVKAWNGQSRLRVLYLWGNHLPVSVCRPLT